MTAAKRKPAARPAHPEAPRYVTRDDFDARLNAVEAKVNVARAACERQLFDYSAAQERYAKELFERASARIAALEEHQVELQARLEEALQTIRPAPTVYPPLDAEMFRGLVFAGVECRESDGHLIVKLRRPPAAPLIPVVAEPLSN